MKKLFTSRLTTHDSRQIIGYVTLFFFVLCPLVDAAETGKDSKYLIRSGDKISIQVYREKELSGSFVVRADGKIDYPLLGEIHAEGLSIEQLKNRLVEDLGKEYLVKPQVQADFEESTSKSITIFGQVQRSGNYLMTPGLTLVKFISQVGSFSVNANLKNIRIMRKRPGEDGKHLIEVDINDIVNGRREDVPLEAGDIVFVDRLIDKIEKEQDFSNAISILGQIEQPGNYHYTPELTLIRLISQAGGFTPFAAPNHVRIVRTFPDGQRKTMMVNAAKIMDGKSADITLERGDLIVIEEALF
jgi:polysaccharide export outer membrane protein